jgi:cytochrome c oxidase subunit 4
MENQAVSHAAADIDKQVRGYMVVFGTLLALTVITVGVSYMHLPLHAAVGVALAIACFKASLVLLFFMHLISERQLIFVILAFTVGFFMVLMFLPILTNLDHIHI